MFAISETKKPSPLDKLKSMSMDNLDRKDLSDYEVALAIQNVQSSFQSKSELTRYLNKTRKELYRYLAFLELPCWLKELLEMNLCDQ